MVVYLDLIVILNILINFVCLCLIEKIFMDKIKVFKILLASTIGGLLVLGLIFDYYVFLVFKIIGGVLIVLIGLNFLNFQKVIIKISLFYIINLTLLGIVQTFGIRDWYYLVLALVGLVIFMILQSYKKYYIFLNSNKYNVSVAFNDYNIFLGGFLDTGNLSSNDEGIPLVYIDEKYYKEGMQYENIMVNTIGGASVMKGYKPKKFEILIGKRKIEKKVLIVFTKLNDVECILNSMMFI